MKPANLTSTLLTRKGLASPTLVGESSRMAVPLPVLPALPSLQALPLLRVKIEPPRQPIEARHGKVESDLFARAPHATVDRRVHMSLRLDPGRHLRLRLESSRTGRSMQSLLTQALDEFLERDGPGTGKPDVGSRREPSQNQRGGG